MDNSEHYNHITTIWPFIMGKNFHWGLFEPTGISLEEATDTLIEKMLSLIHITEGTKLVDIGCGIGGPAFYIAEKYNIQITGISNSQVGIEEANLRSHVLQFNDRVSFSNRDALSTGFPDETFDVAWLLEMSHLIEDKSKLIQESTRILKNDGELVLCDLILKKELSYKDIYANKPNLLILEKSFGKAQLRTIEFYINSLTNLGLDEVCFIDISDKVQGTLDFWIENAKQFEMQDISKSHHNDIENFIKSCSILTEYYSNEQWGYAIFYGKKTVKKDK